MKVELMDLGRVRVNTANPRSITEKKHRLLVENILTFPKMISLRPAIVDNTYTVLGGNMRLRAFNTIAQYDINTIQAIMNNNRDFNKLTGAEKEALLDYWGRWLDRPQIPVVKASELSDAEKKRFIIADNSAFGQWDYDMLANEFDSEDLVNWGVDVWQTSADFSQPTGTAGYSSQPVEQPAQPIEPSSLPPELQNVDINPDQLAKIEGADQTAMERIIIVYPKTREQELANLVGLPTIDKVVYNINELIPEA